MKEEDIQHLKKMLAMARKTPINFGIALGKEKSEDLAFLAHQSRDPKSLRNKARAETGNSKGAHGEMTVDRKKLLFICRDSPPGPLKKAMKLFLGGLKVPLSPEFRLPDKAAGPAKGAPAEAAEAAEGAAAGRAAGEAAPESDGAEAGAAVEKSGRKDKAIMQLFKKLVAQAKDAIAAHPNVREGLLATLKEVDKNLKAGEPEAARDGIIEAGALLRSLAGREVKASLAGAGGGKAQVSENAKAIVARMNGLSSDLKSALAILPSQAPTVKSLIAGVKSNATAEKLDEAEAGVTALKDIIAAANLHKEQLETAREQAEMYRKSMVAMREEQTKIFGATLPATLTAALREIDDLLKTETLSDPAAIDRAIDAAGNKIPGLEKLARALRADRVECLRDLAQVKKRVAALKTHSQAGEALVKVLISGVAKSLAKAEAKSTAHDYADARLDLQQVIEDCAAAELKGDNLAHFNAVYKDREDRVKALPNSTVESVRKEINKAKTNLQEAKKLGGDLKGEYGKALELLNVLPAECIRLIRLAKDAARYETEREALKNSIADAEAWATDITELGPYLPDVNLLYTASDYDATKSFKESVTLIERAQSKLGELFRIVKRYAARKKVWLEAKKQKKELDVHAGNGAILDEISEIQGDLDASNDQFDAKAYTAAKALAAHALSKCADAKTKADQYREYKDELAESEGKMDTFDDAKYPDSVTIQVAACKKWLNIAKNRARAKEYISAKAAAERATIHFKLAEDALDGHVVFLDQAPTDALIDKIDQNWTEVWDIYQQMNEEISAKDGHNFIAVKPDLDEANAAAETAKDAATASPNPDWNTAWDNMKTARKKLYDARIQIDNYGAYNRIRTIVLDRYRALDCDDGPFVGKIEEIERLIVTTAVEYAEGGEWEHAEITLDDATTQCRSLESDCTAFKEYRNISGGRVKELIDNLGKNDLTTSSDFLNEEFEKFEGNVKAADALLAPNKCPEALKALKEQKRIGELLNAKFSTAKDARTAKARWATAKLNGIKDKPVVHDLLKKIEPRIVEMDKKFKSGLFQEAANMAERIGFDIDYAKTFVDQEIEYEEKLKEAQAAQKAMTDVACATIQPEIKMVQANLDTAAGFADPSTRVFKNAMAALANVAPIATAAKAIGEAHKLYAPAAKEAQDNLDALASDFAKSEAVELEVDNQRSLLAKADVPVAARDFAAAKTIADQVIVACAEIRAVGAAQGAMETMVSDIKGRTADDADGLETDIATVQAQLDKLDQHSAKRSISNARDRIKRLLAEASAAQAKPDVAAALKALKDAADQCQMSQSEADAFAGVNKAVTEAAIRITALKNAYAAPPFTAEMLANAETHISLCKSDVASDLYSSAMGALLSARTEIDEAERVGIAHVAYVALLTPLTPRIDDLAKHDARYVIAKYIIAIRAFVSDARQCANRQDYDSCMDMMAKAEPEVDRAELTADMHKNKDIKKADLEKVLGRPGGEGILDDIIKGLDPRAQRKVCKLALEVRFDISFKQFEHTQGATGDDSLDEKGPNITRLYMIMSALPSSHTKGNPSLDRIQKFGEKVPVGVAKKDVKTSSSFAPSTKVIQLRIGRAEEDRSVMINQEWELGEIQDNCKPVDDIPPTMFSWTTLHEIGHAVDDKLGHMSRNGQAVTHAGWREYGSDVSEIATAAAGHFSYNKKYLEAYLSGSKMDPPPPKSGVKQAEWDRTRIKAETWCDSIRHDKKIYNSASATDTAKIGALVYQEAYKGRWVSYLHAKRKEGVRGYQFRAPGEWFAELYAALHVGKMSKSHPARSWLEKL